MKSRRRRKISGANTLVKISQFICCQINMNDINKALIAIELYLNNSKKYYQKYM